MAPATVRPGFPVRQAAARRNGLRGRRFVASMTMIYYYQQYRSEFGANQAKNAPNSELAVFFERSD